jgi:hypothetical protein
MALRRSRTTHHVIFVSCLLAVIGVLLLMTVSPGARAGMSRTRSHVTQKLLGTERVQGSIKYDPQKLARQGVTLQQQGTNSISAPDVFSTCLNGTISASDPLFDHPESLAAACNPSSTTGRYDHYLLNIASCASASVTISACGPAGCAFIPTGTGAQCAAGTAGINDTTISVYRKGGATAGTAAGSGFNPTDVCGTSSAPQRLVAFSDDAGGCGSGTLSSVTVTLGPGNFDVVISGFSDLNSCEGRGTYNLSVASATAGCTLTQLPTAADSSIDGRITDSTGEPVSGAVITLSGAEPRKTITDADGNYKFDNVQTNGFYTVTPSRANFGFSPGSRSFSQLGNRTNAGFTGVSSGDNRNPLDTAEYFVRQEYVDVLGREPDEAGFNYWSDQINACGGEARCVNTRRRDIAAAFFIAQEFQQSGSYVYNVYAGALGRRPAFAEYSSDRQQVVGGPSLEPEKAAFAASFVQRAEFVSKYQANTNGASFVDALIDNVRQTSGVDLAARSGGLLSAYNAGATLNESRALTLRAVTDDAAFQQAQYNPAFVLTEYFAYLRRGAEEGGYNFWLNVLNDSGSNGNSANYRGMVCSFVTSAEYQRRFSSVVSHSNSECGQ